jgi:ATP-dependent RNA helicase DeaD
MKTFSSLGIDESVIQFLAGSGIHEPTQVQQQAIPPALTGRDIMVQAQTGTGKTLAFLLPLLKVVQVTRPFVQALVLTPTRELALQVAREATQLAKLKGMDVLAVYGGRDMDKQTKRLSGAPQIIVGTPGRILDHMEKGHLVLNGVRYLVLDEADTMLSMGFMEEVDHIITRSSPKRQTLLFSATLSQAVCMMAKQYMTNPERIEIGSATVTLPEIEQRMIETNGDEKQSILAKLILEHRPYLAIVFCLTKQRATDIASYLQSQGIDCEELHGDLSQNKREQVMKRFREAKIQVLVATDIAARGLDVEGVTHVYNYDIPHDVDSYIHRIGRTGRAGEKGLAVTLVTPRDRHYVAMLTKVIHTLSVSSLSKSAAKPRRMRPNVVRSKVKPVTQGLERGKKLVGDKNHGGNNLRSRHKQKAGASAKK